MRRTTFSPFPPEEKERLILLGDIASAAIDRDDARAADALHEALRVLESRLVGATASLRATMLADFAEAVGFGAVAAFEEAMTSCVNAGEYAKGEALCDLIVRLGLRRPSEVIFDRAECMARAGRTEESERLLLGALAVSPDEARVYVALGDVYYVWQALDEGRDLDQAEDWYYRGYDRGLAEEREKWGKELLKRLADVCADRLERDAEAALLAIIARAGIGDSRSVALLRETVYRDGPRSLVLHHLESMLRSSARTTAEAARAAGKLLDAYMVMPQDTLGGLSPFELGELIPEDSHTRRILSEMAVYAARPGATPADAGEARAGFTLAQEDFLRGRDILTGKPRRAVIDRERREIVRKHRSGSLVWRGFIRFRRRHAMPPGMGTASFV